MQLKIYRRKKGFLQKNVSLSLFIPNFHLFSSVPFPHVTVQATLTLPSPRRPQQRRASPAPSFSPIEPVLSSIWHAQHLPGGVHPADGTRLGHAPGRLHAVHDAHAHAQPPAAVPELQPVHRARAEDAGVRARGRLDVARLAAAEEQPGGGEVEGRGRGGVEVVVPQKLGSDPAAAQGEVGGGRGERVAGVCLVVRLGMRGGGASRLAGRWVDQVQGDVLAPEDGGGEGVESIR